MIGLTYIMKLEGVTTKELAEFLGVSPSNISQWVSKQRPIPKERLDQLVEYFKYPADVWGKEMNPVDVLRIKCHLLQSRLNDNDNNYMVAEAIRRQIKKIEFQIEKEELISEINTILEVGYKYPKYNRQLFDSLKEWIANTRK